MCALQVLKGLPRLVSVGGARWDRTVTPDKAVTGYEVEVLSLATMRWSSAGGGGAPPALPAPRAGSRRREFCRFADTPSPSLLKNLLKGVGGAAE